MTNATVLAALSSPSGADGPTLRLVDSTLTGRPVPDLDAAVFHARDAGGGSIWIHGSALDLLQLPVELSRTAPSVLAKAGSGDSVWPLAQHRVAPETTAPWAVCHKKPSVSLSVPAWVRGWTLAALEPHDLIRTVDWYQRLIGAEYGWTPGATGTRLMGICNPKVNQLGDSHAPPPAEQQNIEQDMSYFRPPDLAERSARWIVALDQRSRYLTSCSSLALGAGPATFVERPSGGKLTMPGYFRVSWHTRPADGDTVPPAWWPFMRCGEWITTPTLELAMQLGMIAEIHTAWVWPKSSRYLRPWYERLLSALAAIDGATAGYGGSTAGAGGPSPVPAAARALVKRTYTEAIGGLGGHWKSAGSKYRRPDWRHLITALSRANTHRALVRLTDTGLMPQPFAVDVDCYYFATDEQPAVVPAGWRQIGAVRMSQADTSSAKSLRGSFLP